MTDVGVLDFRISRLTLGEVADFKRAYAANNVSQRESIRQISVRLPGEEMEQRPIARDMSADEQALAEAIAAIGVERTPAVEALVAAAKALVPDQPEGKTFVISDADIRRRRLAAMTTEERAAYDALVAAESDREVAFITDTITQFVRVEAGQVLAVDDDGAETSLTTGADLLRLFGAKVDDMRNLVTLVKMENEASVEQKKLWRSWFDSDDSSAAPAKEVPGSAPAPAVDSVEPKASAGPEDATGSSVT